MVNVVQEVEPEDDRWEEHGSVELLPLTNENWMLYRALSVTDIHFNKSTRPRTEVLVRFV